MRIQLTIILFFSALAINAQQLHVSSFFDQYGVMHNPAAAGVGGSSFIGGSFRSQWSGMPGAPQTTALYGSVYFSGTKTGLSSYIYNDVTGPTRRTGLQLAYAYHIPFRKGKLSFGLEGRLQQFSVNAARFEETVGGNDPVFAGDHNQLKGDAGAGIMMDAEKFQLGVSVSQLVQSKLKWTSANTSAQGRLYRHYYLLGSYKWKFDEATVMTPHVLFVYLPNAPAEFQGGARVEHDQAFWYGLAWRAGQSWMLSAGIRLRKQFVIGYSFDMYNKPLSSFDGGSNAHEIMLKYDFRH